jgi:pyruvate,water dikinase
MTTNILSLHDPRAVLDTVGGKGASLARLAAAGFPVPDGFHVTTAAYRRFVLEGALEATIESSLTGLDGRRPEALEEAAGAIREAFLDCGIPADLACEIGDAYEALVRGARTPERTAVAVRSSATAEDLPDLSFAGQQESFLNVRGKDQVLEAVRRCWASLWTGRAVAYRLRTGMASAELALAVVVQVLVDAMCSGVLFTADPTTGRRDRCVIDAAWGLGEAVVGGKVTPDVVIVDRTLHKVIERTTADKTVRTVRTVTGTREEAVAESLRRAEVLSDADAVELADLGVRVEALCGAPTDIEWARTDGIFHLVQARPITALPDEEPTPPQVWEPPIPRTRWSRGSIADFLPDPLTPLFATMGLRVYCDAFKDGMSEMMGIENGGDLYGSEYVTTINGYAFVTMNVTAKLILTLVFRAGGRLIGMIRRAQMRWEAGRDAYREVVLAEETRDPTTMTAAQLLESAVRLWRAAADHLLVYQTSGVSAAVAEMMLTRMWDKDKKRRRAPSDPPASVLLLGYTSEPIRADQSLWDLTQRVRESPALATWFGDVPAAEAARALTQDHGPEGMDLDTWRSFRAAFVEHTDRYGRTLATLDFSSITPVEEPQTFVMTMQHWLSGGGGDPRARQAMAQTRREELAQTARLRARGPGGWLFKKILGWAQRMTPLREDAISALGMGLPPLRRALLEIGRRLAATGALPDATDVFWLEETELVTGVEMLDQGHTPEQRGREIRRRKALWRSRKRVLPPHSVPHTEKIMGFKVSDFVADGSNQERGILKGVAASGGKVQGPARVLHGVHDFYRMKAGAVLVAEITTPAWTPLFALAAAVVTDTGGPLSHGSIVAREYGIPAVLGTGSATRRIHDGDIVTVDGEAGSVTWAEE